MPDVTEVEVNAEGLWRPAGTDMTWQSTLKDTAPLSKAQLTKPQLAVKPDPDQASDGESFCSCFTAQVVQPLVLRCGMHLLT